MKPEQEALFSAQGYVSLPGVLGKSVVAPIKSHLLQELKRQNIWSTGRTLSSQLKGVPIFQQVGKLGQMLQMPRLREKLITPEINALLGRLAGAHSLAAQDAQLLISLPNQGEWTLDGLNWHRDISLSKLAKLPGIQAFVLLDDVVPHGGATLALAGSHRLKGQHGGYQSIASLIDERTGRGVAADGTEIFLLEMSGRAGDVYLMDMRLIHTPSINASRNVRLMATIRYVTA